MHLSCIDQLNSLSVRLKDKSRLIVNLEASHSGKWVTNAVIFPDTRLPELSPSP